jgi:murein DD-endopeptidase MepM/ murein hydrolase activator NlpD
VPPSRLPRHAAAETSRSRAVLPPVVLLASAALAFGGLAVMPHDAQTAVRVTAAAATSPLVLKDPATTSPSQKDLDALYGIPTAVSGKVAAGRIAPRASRARRAPAGPKWVRPGIGRFTSGFKWRWGRMHTGIDLAGPYGSPVRSVGDGEVIEAGREGGYGNIVKVRLTDGTVTYYAHMSKILIHSGPVKAGDIVGKEGNTGHSTGPHVHFEVRIDGVPINPIPWLAKRGIYI